MRTETERPRRDAPGSTPGTISHQHLRGHSLLLIRSVRGREFFFKGPQGFGERTQCPLKHTLCHGYSHTVIGDRAAGGSSRPYTGEHLSPRNDAAPAVNHGLIRLRIEGKLLSGRDRNIQLSPCQLTEQTGKLDPADIIFLRMMGACLLNQNIIAGLKPLQRRSTACQEG